MISKSSRRIGFSAILTLGGLLFCRTSFAADYLKNDVGFYQPVVSLAQANRRAREESPRAARGYGILISEAGDNIGRKTFLEKPAPQARPPVTEASNPS